MYLWIALLIAAPLVLYGLHRLALQMEERGYIYYRKERPAGGASPFFMLQEIYDPQAAHVISVEEQTVERAGDDRVLPGTPPEQRPETRDQNL